MQRRALNAVALALGLASAFSAGGAQTNRNLPGADTPRLLVVVFQSTPRGLGVEAADALRLRMTNNMNARVLYIIPREQMVNFLVSSGYNADSSLGPTDLKELARGLRADELLGGVITKTPSGGFHIEPRLMMSIDPSVGQPLPVIETGSLNDAARQIERAYHEARKQLMDDRACKNHIRSGAIDKAIASAQAGIAKYPNAVIARLCLTNAYQQNKQWDSVLSVTGVINKLDKQSKLANTFAVDANKAKADAETDPAKSAQYREEAVRLLVAMLAIEPNNQKLQGDVITELAKLGKPAVAIPIVEELLKQNPGDPPLLKQRWQLIALDAAAADSATKQEKLARVLAAGEEMVKSDTTLADSTYYFRQVAAAMQMTPQRGIEWTSRAVGRYPTNQDYWWYKANRERAAGQVPAASQSLSRLLVLNPKYPNATVMAATLYIDQRMMDSAVAIARRAIANGEAKATWGNVLVAPMNAQYQAASAADEVAKADSTNRDKRAKATFEYEAALTLAQEVDKLSPSAHSKFFTGVSSFQIGYAAVNRVQVSQAALARAQGAKVPPRPAEVAAQRASMCTDAKRAQDMFLLTMTNLPQGGSVSPASAQAILGAMPQLTPFADQAATTFCRAAPAGRPAATATKTPPKR